jgi:hypothetical protein
MRVGARGSRGDGVDPIRFFSLFPFSIGERNRRVHMTERKTLLNRQRPHNAPGVASLLPLTVVATMLLVLCSPLAHAWGAGKEAIPKSVTEQLDAYIERYVAQREAEDCEPPEPGEDTTCKGSEYRAARRFCFGDIGGHGKKDIAVLYTLESFCCGNNYEFHLAVFLNRNSKYELVATAKVGGGGERFVSFNTIRDGKIFLNTDLYLPDDPNCCPSGKGSTTYVLEGGKLVERDRVGNSASLHERFERNYDKAREWLREHRGVDVGSH